jgi:homopolymeric O-antigen transport system permease protein
VAWTAALAPFGVALLIALGSGIGLILAPLNFLYRDVSKALPVITTLWFFMTPVIYVPPLHGIAAVIMQRINPVTQILLTTRNLIFPGSGSSSSGLLFPSLAAIFIFCAGMVFHRVAMPVVIDRANA